VTEAMRADDTPAAALTTKLAEPGSDACPAYVGKFFRSSDIDWISDYVLQTCVGFLLFVHWSFGDEARWLSPVSRRNSDDRVHLHVDMRLRGTNRRRSNWLFL
jgi:hypothetical protein